MNTEVIFVQELLFFPKSKSGELDNTCASAKYYAARLGNSVLLSVNDDLSDRTLSRPEFLDLRLVFLDQRVACPSIGKKMGDRTRSILKFANVQN